MEAFLAIAARFPNRILEIRRRCARDLQFRAVCGDYEEAAAALRRWRAVDTADDRRVREYTLFLAELETEILARLQGPEAALRSS